MRIISRFSTLLLVCLLLITVETYAFDRPDLPIPAGTKVSLQLLSLISTSVSKKGDRFSCSVLTPAEYAGAIVEGYVRDLKRSGKGDKESRIDLAFTKITMPDGREAELSAQVIEVFDVAHVGEQGRADNEGVVRNKSTTVKTSVKRAAVGAVFGAIVGGIVAGGAGAAAGAAIGASLGVTTTLATRGADLEFKEGTQFTVQCSGPTRRKGRPTREAGPSPRVTAEPQLNSVSAPDLPSRSYREYTANKLFRLSVPKNWQESPTANGVSFTPERGYVNDRGRKNVTHGIMVGVAPSTGQDLQAASEQLAGAFLQGNSYLHRQGEFTRGTIAGRGSGALVLSGRPEGSARQEMVTLHVAFFSQGQLLYVITVVPQEEFGLYQEAFDNILKSIQIK